MLRSILVVVLLAGGGFLAWFSLSGEAAQPASVAAVVPMVKILVAAEPLQAGALLKETDLKEREVAAGSVAEADIVATDDNRAEVRGSMVRHYLDAGQALQRADILRPRDRGFLATVLTPGTRAISIGVDATTGASGLISPGDLVDVILTQEFARGETTAGRRVVAETVLSKVRVIAVDQQITQGASASGPLQAQSAARVASNISLQVTPEQAARIVVASHLGKLTLTVRSIEADAPSEVISADAGSVLPGRSPVKAPTETQASVFGSDVSMALSNEAPAAVPKLRVIQGDSVSDMVFH